MCGYDAAYALDEGVEADREVLRLAETEGRTILTRDAALAARATDAVALESRAIECQLRELAGVGFALELPVEPTRCGVCNATLDRVGSREPVPEYAPDPDGTAVWRCPDCGKHFWRGSHWEDVADTLEAVG
jgi:uncharacterized protein with PIN domain